MGWCFLNALLIFICGITVHAVIVSDVYNEFIKFNLKYGRSYKKDSDEFQYRLQNFKKNLILQQQFSSNGSTDRHNLTAVYGITKFSDLSLKEFKELYLQDLIQRHVRTDLRSRPTPLQRIKSLKIPPKLDWRTYLNHSIVSSVKNQKKCGACWAFSTVETVESVYAKINKATPPSLSVQEVIDCANNNQGCSGGDTCQALQWMQATRTPIVTDKEYPLTDESNFCKILSNGTKGVKVQAHTCSNYVGKEDGLLQLLYDSGPVSAAVDANTWFNYQGGVIQWHCRNSINHAVQIVGYDISGDIPYYIVRNSWGTDFGNDGYLYIKIGANVCGIAEEVSSVEVGV